MSPTVSYPLEPPTDPARKRPSTVKVLKSTGKAVGTTTIGAGGLIGLLTLLVKLGVLQAPAWASVEEEREKAHATQHVAIEHRLSAGEEGLRDANRKLDRLLWHFKIAPAVDE